MFKEFHYQVRGHGHLRDGTPVQDRTKYLSRGGVQVLCLADGAGSASHSQFGAQAVVDEGCAALVEQFAEFASSDDGVKVKVALLERLVSKVASVAERHDVTSEDLASTFLCVAVAGDTFLAARRRWIEPPTEGTRMSGTKEMTHARCDLPRGHVCAVRRRGPRGPRGGTAVMGLGVLAAVLGIAAVGYMGMALLRPERF